MYYPELLEIIDKIGTKDAIEKIDKYLAFLPNRSEKILTISGVANKLELDFTIVEVLFKCIYEIGLLKKVYICKCPECGREIFTCEKDTLLDKVKEFSFCRKCKGEIEVSIDDVYVGFKVIKQPNLDENGIREETERLLGISENINSLNDLESLKELFDKDKENPHDFFYNPSEADREEFKRLFESLDLDYGDSTTAQGKALEGLICKLFGRCRGMTATPIIRTPTNQIDCTVRNDYLIRLTVYNELGSIVNVECKNEPKDKPDNNYYHKLRSIITGSKNDKEQAVGIIVSRLEPTGPCKILAREYFLLDKIIIINICDEDLKRIIYNKANFLDVLQEKIQTIKRSISTDPEKHKLYR